MGDDVWSITLSSDTPSSLFDDICSLAWKEDHPDTMTLDINFVSLGINDLEEFDKEAAIKKATEKTKFKAEPQRKDYKNDSQYALDLQKWNEIIGSINKQEDDHQNERKRRARLRKLLPDIADGLYKRLANFYDTCHVKIYRSELGSGLSPSSLYKDQILDSLTKVKLKDYDPKLSAKPELKTFTYDLDKTFWDGAKMFLTRKWVDEFTRSVSKDLGNLSAVVTLNTEVTAVDDAYKSATNWHEYVDALVSDGKPTPPAKGFGGNYAKQKVYKTFKTNWWDANYANPWRDTTVNRHRWRTGVQGKILMSDSPSTTISFDRKGGTVSEVNVIASNTKTEMIKILKSI